LAGRDPDPGRIRVVSRDNAAPPVRTDCRVTYDPGNLFVACHAWDPKPAAIRAHLADRDDLDRLPGDDHVLLLLDPFNDNRHGFQFRVNAVGVQMDALFAPTEGIEDFSWDAIWESAGRIGDDGYVVEIRIPFRSLRFPARPGEQTWGMIIERSWPRSARHRIQSAPRDQADACVFCQANKLTGFAGITPGSNVELYPTLTSRRTDERASFPDGPLESGDLNVDPGLDLRWGVTPNLSLNATGNPDFSQVEADVAQLDVNTRFALFFPERRPFFLEGSDVFATPIQAVFTRTVADPTGGLKLTGKLGGAGIGVFTAHDRVTNLIFPANQGSAATSLETNTVTGVMRFRRDLGRASNVGFLYTGREGVNGYANRVAGVDAFLQLTPSHSLSLQGLGSETGYPDAVASAFGQPTGRFTGTGVRAGYAYGTRNWAANLTLEALSPDFRADAGFVPRVDLRSAEGALTRTVWGGPGRPFTQQRVDFRVIAAVQDNIAALVAAGLFRRDLYHRVAGIVLWVPPLRERREDIVPLAAHFAAEHGRTITAAAAAMLRQYDWPGNVRELRAVIQRAAVLATEPALGPFEIAQVVDGCEADTAQREVERPADAGERLALLRVCEEHRGPARAIAQAAGLSRATLFRRLKALGITLRTVSKSRGSQRVSETGETLPAPR
jgi:hypothetical protein